MIKKRKFNCTFIFLTFLAMTLVIVSSTIADSDTKKKEGKAEKKVVAKVNRKPIYEDQLDKDVEQSLKKWKKYGMKQQTPELTYKLQKKP